jgi:predicted nucleic acid-binding Zn ribbon protein
VRRQVSAPAFQFKGSGWYVTDYAGKGKGEAKKTEGAAEAGSEGKTAKSDDKKAEKKADKQTESKPAKADKGGD